MKPTSFVLKPIAMSLIGMVVASIAGNALASDLPKRKPGLWEISMNVDGVPNMGPMQQCIDRDTDNLMQQEAEQHKPDCSVMDVKQSGNKVTIHTVCKMEGSTVTTDGVFEGSFETRYKGTMKSRFNPPMQGMSESNMTQEARWIGPCKPGQKPGDVDMPNMGANMGGMDINKMMNDPKLKEMMKQYQDEE